MVDQVPTDSFTSSTDDQLIQHFSSKLTIEPVILYEDCAEMEQVEAQIDVSGDSDRYWSPGRTGPRMIPGTSVTITIPFTGDPELWKLQPNPCRMSFPSGRIKDPYGDQAGELEIVIEKPHDAGEELYSRDLESILSDIRHHLANQEVQVQTFNNQFQTHIQNAISARRERLNKHGNLTQVLNIPLKRKDGAPSIEPIKVEKKITQPLPFPPKSGLKPEPGITDELYENILNIVRHEGRTFETAPATFAKFEEEELRDVVLAHLNGHYQGGATGETFRKLGKTDIRIEDEDRAAFIGECKIWRGAKELLSGIDQLLGYLTWRDCKSSLIIFNKEIKGFSKLLETVPEALLKHPLLEKDLGKQGEGEWRHIFRSEEDEERLINVHTFLFNLYIK